MKCLNCNHENKLDALFCEECGNKLIKEENQNNNYNNHMNNNQMEGNHEQNHSYNNHINDNQMERNQEYNYNMNNNNYNQNPTPNNNYNQNYMPNNTNKKSKKNVWLIIGIIAVVLVGLAVIVFSSGDSSYNSEYQPVNDRKKFQSYLTSVGFTEQSTQKYSYYREGYTYTFDFNENIFSQEKAGSMYNAYYYKEDFFGTAIQTDSLKVVSTYTYSTSNYTCKVEPQTYENYTCSYMKPTITKLAETIKNTFYTFITNAGVSVNNL